MTILRVIDWINTNFAGELVASPSPMNSFGLNEPCSWAAQIQVTGNNGLSVGIAPMGIAHPLDRGDGEERVKLMFRADMEASLSLPRTILHRFAPLVIHRLVSALSAVSHSVVTATHLLSTNQRRKSN